MCMYAGVYEFLVWAGMHAGWCYITLKLSVPASQVVKVSPSKLAHLRMAFSTIWNRVGSFVYSATSPLHKKDL